MSALAGIFKFDPRDRVSRTELIALSQGIDRIGPDGGGEYLGRNLGMAYRAFHTTPNSHFESQPLSRNGCILTWDGRLDNREEICAAVSRKFQDTGTDLELVCAAYTEWGVHCFARLLGDWSLALWDEAKRTLLLSRDCFGTRTLYYKVEEDGVKWCSVLEPLAVNTPRPMTADLRYLQGCISPYPPLGTSPFREISAVLPAHFVAFHLGGKADTTRYWALDPTAKIRYRTDTEYEEHFRFLFRQSVYRRVRTDRPVLAELSGGLDSSSIVCMADLICAQEGGSVLATISYYNPDEPGGDERPYISVIEEHRGIAGHHISVSDFNRQTQCEAFLPLPEEYFAARPGHFQKSLRWAALLSAVQNESGSRVILSGLGGDEFLGGVQFEALELAEHLFAARILTLLRSLFQWSLARRKTLLALAKDTWRLCRARSSLESFTKHSAQLDWFLQIAGPPDFTLQNFSSWQTTSPAHLCAESTRYSLASMLSCIDPPLIGIAEKRYPYLDRQLYEFMASIPRTQTIRPRERRSLMRRSLRGIVPDLVLYRKTKWFGYRSTLSLLQEQNALIEQMFEEPWLSDGVLFDVSLLHERILALQHGLVVEGLPLTTAIAIEQWLRRQTKCGTITVPTTDPRTVITRTSHAHDRAPKQSAEKGL